MNLKFSDILITLFLLLVALILRAQFVPIHHYATNACVNNLRWIQQWKQQWGADHGNDSNAIPSETDLIVYCHHGTNFPTCPSGGTYTLGPLSQPPTCSLGKPDHALPISDRQ
jgi:hypothetical protein